MGTVQSLIDEYAQSLAALSGNDFQVEVCARLQAFILGFQTVPANPHGDGGLDAFSHHGERGYCCFGPEHDKFKTNRQREAAIVDKFKGDLRRLFELEFENKVLKVSESPEMATILPDGRKINHIELLVNWFESHRILNPILSAAEEYGTVSKCRYVEQAATVIVVGPKQLANQYAVDELTIARARQRVFIQKVQKKAELVTLGSTDKFDLKLGVLKEVAPTQVEAIDALWRELQMAWRMALAFEQELDETLPNLHRVFEANRHRILTRVSQLMVGSGKPWTELERATQIASEILGKDFEKLYGALIQDVSSGEIARLIGECPVGWEKPVTDA